jgi:hypothetical protein
MVAGLAYYLSLKLPGAEMRIEMLKAAYEEAFQLEKKQLEMRIEKKLSVRFVPREMFYHG